MKQISFTEFKKMTAAQIKDEPCMEVTGDGERLFIAVIGTEGLMIEQIKARCSQIDAARGK
jgi:hypothetical protein